DDGRAPPRSVETATVRNENITILGPKALLEEIRLMNPRVDGFAGGNKGEEQCRRRHKRCPRARRELRAARALAAFWRVKRNSGDG
ncbi:MAG: hypothetical protein ABSA58_24745, partial [Acetobacteraceae bacterium]